MKKFLKAVVLVFVVGCLGYWAYKYFNNTAAVVNKIHVDAESVVKVNLHHIKETLVWDALTSPSYYYNNTSGDSDKEQPKDSVTEKGIDLQPYAVVFYVVKDLEDVVFATLDIENSVAFESYIGKEIAKKKQRVQQESDSLYRFVILEKNKVVLAWNTEQLVVALSPELTHQKATTIFEDILVEQKVIKDKNNPIIAALRTAKDHITFVRKEDQIGINFKDGEVSFEGDLINKSSNTFESEITTEVVSGASFQIHWDYSFEQATRKKQFINLLKGRSFLEKNNLEAGKIANRTNGFFSLAIKGTTVQTDTIITYAYDDNFEKIAQKSTQEKEVPKIHINLGAANKSLKDYLIETNTVEQDIFKALPYYNFYVKDGTLNTSFDTYRGQTATKTSVTSNFFDCKIDFNKLQEDLDIPQTKAIFQLLDTSRFRAYQLEENNIVVKGNIKGLNKEVNILSQIFFGIKEAEKDSLSISK